MIDANNLTKWYGNVRALDDVSFHVDSGAVAGFLGPNGAGKSTTLKILTCYLPATSGQASIAGHDVLNESLAVRREVGYMPESVPLYPEMRVREYLAFRAALRDIPRRERGSAIDRVGERCWLSTPEDMMDRRLDQLSRGYRQRVGLADVLLHNPSVLILDEPTIGLDPAQIRAMRDLIRELAAEHTVIFSSHILAEVEQICSHLIIIAGGRIAASGSLGELREQMGGATKYVAELRGAEASELSAAVRRVAGVRKVETSRHGNWTRLEIETEGQADCRSDAAALAATRDWQLRELRREQQSLEDYFIRITYEQNVQAGEMQAAG